MFKGVEPADDWYLHTKSDAELNSRTIALTSIYGTRTSFFTANSNKLVEGLYELGWLNPSSQEYKDRQQYFREELAKRQLMASIDGDARNVMFRVGVKNHTLKALKSKPDRLNKLRAVREILLKEGTTRSRILQVIGSQYSAIITREDLRKIMALK